MTSLPSWMTPKTLGTAAACAVGAALVLHPACLVTLGAGTFLGYKGKDWIRSYLNQWEAKL